MSSLSLLGIVFFMLVMIGAFAVRSAAGFGAVLIAMPMLAFVLPISTAVSVTTALTAITSVHHLSRDWRRVAWRHFAIMAFYSAIGIGLGFYFIKMLDERALRHSLGVFLILYSIYALATAKASWTVSARWRGPLAAGTGIAGGLLGTLFGAGVGPIYVVYFNALRLEREIFRVTMSTVVLLGGAARIAGYASFGPRSAPPRAGVASAGHLPCLRWTSPPAFVGIDFLHLPCGAQRAANRCRRFGRPMLGA